MRSLARSRRQAGMALIVSLVLLLSMTLLALAAMQNTSLEERMAGNVRSENIALQAAESALREAELEIAGWSTLPGAVQTGGSGSAVDLWIANDDPWWLAWTKTDWEGKADTLGEDLVFVSGRTADGVAISEQALDGQGSRPRFVIEEAGYLQEGLVIGQQQDVANQINRFRITARGVDAGGRGEVLLQTRFVRRF